MPDPGKILVTGATGNTGLELIRLLKKKQFPLVEGVRNNLKDKAFLGGDIATVTLDFEKPETFKDALKGVTKVFLVRPPAISNVRKFIIHLLTPVNKQASNILYFYH